MNKVKKFAGEALRLRRILSGPDFLRWCGLVVANLPTILRTGSLGAVDQAFGERVRFRCGGEWLVIEKGALGVVREIIGAHCYIEPEELAQAQNILDLGANCGVFSLFALANAPAAKVVAVEAQPPMAEVARENLARNGLDSRVNVINGVAGTKTNFIHSLLDKYPDIQAFNPTAYLDEVGSCDFLKCDIEGAEFGFITSAATWLRRVKRISLEYHGKWEDGAELKSVLEGHGFSVEQQPHGVLGYLVGRRPA